MGKVQAAGATRAAGAGKASAGSNVHYRLMVASRVVAGFVGGYLLTSLAMVVLTLLLARMTDTSQAVALSIVTMWSFVLYAVTIIWAFTVRSATRAWVDMGIAGVVLALMWWLLRISSS